MLSRLPLPVYPSSPKAPWISIQTAIPTAVGSTMASSVHRRPPVSRRPFRSVAQSGDYQIFTRSSGATYSLSPALTSKAEYQPGWFRMAGQRDRKRGDPEQLL